MSSLMIEWLNTPVIIIVVIAIGTLLWKAIRWTSNVDNNLSSLTENVKEIREDIKKLFSALPPATVAGASPLHLTEFGERIAASLDADGWASELAPKLSPEVKGKEPFEIDEFCRNYVQTRLTEEWRRRVAICAYEVGIDKDGVEKVLTVVLRDKLLQP